MMEQNSGKSKIRGVKTGVKTKGSLESKWMTQKLQVNCLEVDSHANLKYKIWKLLSKKLYDTK